MSFNLRLFSAFLWIAASAAALAAQPAEPAEPGHYVFVFHRDKDVAEVFDGASLTRLGTPRVGLGAFRAFGLPGSNDTGAGAKFYVLTPRAVHVLDGGFHETATISLSTAPLPGGHGAGLSSDGRTLLVATSGGLYLIETATDTVAAYLPAGFEVAGLALSNDAGRAYLAAAGTRLLRPVDLASRRLLDELALLAVELESWDRSPNGLRALGLGEDAIYEINRKGTVPYTGAIEPVLRRAAEGRQKRATSYVVAAVPSPKPERRLTATNSGWIYIEDAGRLWRESLLGGVAEMVADARTASAVRLDKDGGWDASPAGEAVYVTNGEGELARIPADPAMPVLTAALLEAGGEVEAVTPHVEQAGTLGLVTTNNLVVAGGTRFQITVKATNAGGGAESGVPVFVSNRFPTTAPVSCFTAITAANGEGILDCTMGEITAPAPIQLTISDTRGRSAPIVNIQAVIPTDFEGLALLAGGGERIPLDVEHLIVVQVSRRRVPVEGETLSLTTVPASDVLTCPRNAKTDAEGKATFVCRSARELEEGAESVEFTIRGNANSALTGSVIVDPEAVAPTGLTKVQGDGQLVPQGQPVQFVVARFEDGAPVADSTLNITVLDPGTPPVMTCPTNARTNAEGIGRFTCTAGTIFGARRSVQIQVSNFGVTLAEPFTVIVTESSFGFAQSLEFVSDENLRLPVGQPVLDAIQVKAVTDAGDPVPNVTVHFFALSAGEITIDPPSARTDSEGIASATVTVGCNSSPVTVGVGFEPNETFLDLTVRPEEGSFAQITILQGDGQNGAPGQVNPLALVAQTSDACGQPLPQQSVTWRVKPAFAATLQNVVSRSDSRGRVSARAMGGQYGGPYEVEVGAGEIFATFNLAVNLPASELRAVSGSGQTVGSGQEAAQPLVAQALGSNGFGVSDIPVQWSVAEGPGTITQSEATTGAAGIAFARVRVGGGSGPRVRIEAKALGQTVSFLLNSTDGPQAPAAGFTNGASFQTGWTQGGTGSIFGVALADQLVGASAAPFPTSLSGVTVRINGTPAPLIFVSPGQINLQVPFDAAVGAATVEINNNGKALTVSGVQINALQPGIFERELEGGFYAAALHEDSTPISPSSPARPGEVVQLFFTGGGALNPAVPTNQPGPASPLAFTAVPVIVRVDGVEQQGAGSVYAPNYITLYQVNFRLSANAAAGNRQLQLEMQGVTSKTVTLPVGPAAAP